MAKNYHKISIPDDEKSLLVFFKWPFLIKMSLWMLLYAGAFGELQADPADSLQQRLRLAKSDREKMEINLQLSALTMKTDSRGALEYGQQAVFLARSIGKPDDMIIAYKTLASLCLYSGLMDQAIECLSKCQEEAEKSNNAAELMNAQLNLGVIRLKLEDNKQARDILRAGERQMLETYQKLGKPTPTSDLVTLYLNIGLSSVMMGDVRNGIHDLKKAISLMDSASLKSLQHAKILQTWCLGLIKLKEPDSAIQLIHRTRGILEALGQQIYLTGLRALLGPAYELKGNWDGAIEEYRLGFTESTTGNNPYMQEKFTEMLYLAFDKVGKKDSSYVYLKRLNEYRATNKETKIREELVRQEILQTFREKEAAMQRSLRMGNQRNWLLLVGLVSSIGLSAWFVIFYRRRYYQSQLRQMKMELEAEKTKLDQELLRARLEQQDAELSALNYRMDKNQMLEKLVSDLQKTGNPGLSAGRSTIVEEPSGNTSHVRLWSDFEIRFLQMHADFYDRLMAACPDLTSNERRLCAFLKMDMSTKEISLITGQSVRSINMARFRLRQKLKLTNSETSLFDFLATLY
jgi:tetratricopeptide (TPR) repeat protein/DNA-binding CsgD family transcriptional regulator